MTEATKRAPYYERSEVAKRRPLGLISFFDTGSSWQKKK
jgi:hypothetical protein